MSFSVYKFGGTSVADAERMRHAAALAGAAPGPVVVVTSAMAGVTNELIALGDDCARGAWDTGRLAALHARHRTVAEDLGLPGDFVDELFAEIHDLLAAGAALYGLTPRGRDRLVATGEKLAVRLLAGAFDDARKAVPCDADTFLETDDQFGAASPLPGVAARAIAAALEPRLAAGETPVVTGFCGRAPCGSTTTLGRGGSDFSATLVGAAINAELVTIWTDVPGVFSANPKEVPDARVIDQLNYREAGELSFYGAKVLHPRTIQPLIDPGIPARIASTFEPDASGTLIDGTIALASHPVKAVSAIPAQALVSIEGTGMAGVPGIAARIFSTLAEAEISVTMISQSSAESSVCFAIPARDAASAEVALRSAFRLDLAHGAIEEIRVEEGVALVAAVGLGMHHATGVAGRVFDAVARAGVNVVSIAQGASELNITFAVDGADAARAVRAVHHEFGLHRIDPGEANADAVDLLVFGAGRIGRALSDLVAARKDEIRARFGVAPRLTLAADRSGFLFRASGLSDDDRTAIRTAKEAGTPIASLDGAQAVTDPVAALEHALDYRLARPIVVDATDGSMLPLYAAALERGADVVTANKEPLSGPADAAARLRETAARGGRQLRHEATVGAGLPIVDTIEHLLATGDRLTRIEGCVSGTLSFVLAGVEAGRAFTDVLADADERGYIEPNPLVDLSGEDVRRKAVILARVAGFDVPDDAIECTGLVDRGLLGLDRDAFLARAAEFDAPLRTLIDDARAAEQVVRYVACVEPDRISVAPRAVARDTPLGNLSGPDNMVLLWSERYAERPLIISGPGAGVDVTVMGMLTDILRIVAERG